jgi:DNA polymerase-3 subunit delta
MMLRAVEYEDGRQILKQDKSGRGFREMERDLKTDGLASVRAILLYGPEAYLVKTYEDRLRARYIQPAAEMLDYSRFDGEEADVADIIAACDTFPMLSEKRVVTVAGLPLDEKGGASPRGRALAEYIPGLPASTLLLITANKASRRTAPYLAIAKTGVAYEFSRLERRDLRAFIRHRLKDEGLGIAEDVVDELSNATGYLERDSEMDLLRLAGDLRRIASYAASEQAKEVRLSHVAACVDTSPETNVFAMLDAVSAGRKGEAMELAVNITAETGESGFRLLALLTGQFELMLGYRELKEQGVGFTDMLTALSVKSSYRLKKAAGFADRYSLARLMELLGRLYRVEQDIKTGLYGERLALTMFIAEM